MAFLLRQFLPTESGKVGNCTEGLGKPRKHFSIKIDIID